MIHPGLEGPVVELSEVLQCREKRAEWQTEMMAIYHGTIISFTVNMPGPVKCNSIGASISLRGIELLLAALRQEAIPLLGAQMRSTPIGHEWLLAVSAEPRRVKAITCAIEDGSSLGRLLDLDVIASDGKPFARTEIGLPKRTCLLCGKESAICARSRAHSVEDLLQRIASIAEEEGLVRISFQKF